MEKKYVTFYIHPHIRGKLTPVDLIKAYGNLRLGTPRLGKGEEIIFRVSCSDYYLQVGFTTTSFYIIRNSEKLEISNEPFRQDETTNYWAIWRPTEMSLLILDKSYYDAIALGANETDEIEKRAKVLKTSPIIPPNSLIKWMRKRNTEETTTYDSISHFNQEVTSAMQSISDKILVTNMYKAFWDITYEGAKIVSRKPKKEPDIHPIIHGLIFDIAIAKNFEISPEFQIGCGKLDFLISGHLKTGETVNVCAEFKHAHSLDLEDGILKQLPEYMRVKGCDFGLYCVFFFKGEYFTEPKKFHLKTIDFHLYKLATSAGLYNIRTLTLNCDYPKPPSQL